MACFYCSSMGPFNDEHVLARAFAGGGENWMLRDDKVCKACNTLFSTYERAWTSAPGESIARSYWGPSGREREGRAYQVHPSEHVFLIANGDPVSYEADILRGIEPRLRAQVIATADTLAVHASAEEDFARLAKASQAFLRDREITVQKRREPGPLRFRVAVFSGDADFSIERIELRSKPTPVWLDRFPIGMPVAADPRLSIDAFNRLRLRATGLKQAASFLRRLLADPLSAAPAHALQPGSYQVAVRSRHDTPRVLRAVAKTAVNYAADEFGAGWISEPGFRPVLDYCLGKCEDPPGAPFVGLLERPSGILAIDKAPPERHALALASDGRRVIALIRLYGGGVWRVHLGPAPKGTGCFQRAVWIDYNGVGRVPPLSPIKGQ